MLTSYLALDVGRARIGIALANDIARIASPLPTLANDELFVERLQALIKQHDVSRIIIGWPRGLDGQMTDQTRYVESFMANLAKVITLPMGRQDEALTSVKAESELERRGVPYERGDIDSLSAVFILDDFLAEGVH